MNFFEKLKEELEGKLTDITTIEHAIILEDNGECLYRFQQIEGDNLSYLGTTDIDKEYYLLLNDVFSASMEARSGITQFIIECIT
jgi:hypothetical protein